METLVIIDQPPYGSWTGREALDMAFALAAFDQPVSLMFSGAGVNWLRSGQLTEAIGQKSVEKNLSAAPVFGISAIMADATACKRYGLGAADLPDQVTRTDLDARLLARYTHTVFAG